MVYLQSRDSVVIQNSNLEIECYNFQSLQIAAEKNKVEDHKDSSNERKITPDWVCNIGEQPQHMVTHLNRYTRQTDIIVTGETSLFVLNERGEIRY